MKWNNNFNKPKDTSNDHIFDIQIKNDSNEFRIVRNCKYCVNSDVFEEYGTEISFKRNDIVQWSQQIKVPCNNCQGGGCATCNGYGYWIN